jgi:hypothetical protein
MRLKLGDPFPHDFFDGARKRILELQREDGAIPWYAGGVVDPWNHTEAAMGLTLLGEIDAARNAFAFLANTQLEDGSWWGELGAIIPLDETAHYIHKDEVKEKPIRDTNFTAYIATGAWHHYLITRDRAWLTKIWPHVEAATGFVLAHQSEHGDIRWAADEARTPEDDALITGCSSIYKSLECAAHIAAELGAPRNDWMLARAALGNALRLMPHRFDRTWPSKDRFSMDWYYPVLAGVVTGEAARARLAAKWDLFVAESKGCRCVHDAPWVTVAESAELVLALLAAGERRKAEEMLEWQHQWRDDAGAYWMGYQFENEIAWPAEKPAWTSAAIILAADAVTGASAAAHLFAGKALAEAAE